MSRLFSFLCIASIAAGFVIVGIHCTTPLSGGGTEGGNTVAGVFINDDGSTSAKVQVLLIPSDYNPGAAHSVNSIDTSVTAGDGSYSFEHVAQGGYSIEAADRGNGHRTLVTGVVVDKNDTSVSVDTLRPPGAIRVFLSATADIATGYIYVPGTTTHVLLAGTNGSVVVNTLPAKSLQKVCYATLADTTSVVLRYNVQVASGDTTAVANTGWNYSCRLYCNTTATGAGVSTDVHGFPMLVRLTKNNFDFAQANVAGADVRFARSDTVGLPCEIERWDPVAGFAEVWVRVDTVYGNDSTQYITMFWGNVYAPDSSSGAAVFDTSNGFIGVWHMNEDPASGAGSIKDRTVNAHHATSYGSMTDANSVNGTVGKALRLDGADDYLNAGNVTVPGTYSIGLWVLLDTLEIYQRLVYKDSSYTLWYDKDEVSLRMEHMNILPRWYGILQNGGTRVPVTIGVWYYVVATFDGTTIRFYANGMEVSRSNAITVLPGTSSEPLFVGKSDGTSFVNGVVDELRIEGRTRSAEWIRLCYMNQQADDKLLQFK